MNFKILQVFLSVNRSLSFTESADSLHMSVSAVSRAIARLEADLGCTLFDRDRRGMRPTSAANRLRPFAESVLAEWNAVRRSLDDVAALRGELRIYSSVTASRQLLSPLLRAFRSACPGVDVRLQTGDPADGIEQVTQGQADVAVIARPLTLPETLVFSAVARTPLEVCLPSSTGLLEKDRADLQGQDLLDVLAGLPWILPDRGVTRALTDAWLAASFPSEPKVYARVAGHEAIAAMVSLGLGVGIAPRLVVEASGPAESIQLRPMEGLPSIEIGLCTRAGRLADPVVASLMARADASRGHES